MAFDWWADVGVFAMGGIGGLMIGLVVVMIVGVVADWWDDRVKVRDFKRAPEKWYLPESWFWLDEWDHE